MTSLTRTLALVAAVSAAVLVAPARARSHPLAPDGVYVMTSAVGVKPPIAFALPLAGITATGHVDGARVVLDPDGSYTSDVVVRWSNVPPLPGFPAPGEQRVMHGNGRYTVSGADVVFTPDDWMTRQLMHSALARASATTLVLRAASGGLAGDHQMLDVQFVRVR